MGGDRKYMIRNTSLHARCWFQKVTEVVDTKLTDIFLHAV